jgi:hypothetical protein
VFKRTLKVLYSFEIHTSFNNEGFQAVTSSLSLCIGKKNISLSINVPERGKQSISWPLSGTMLYFSVYPGLFKADAFNHPGLFKFAPFRDLMNTSFFIRTLFYIQSFFVREA